MAIEVTGLDALRASAGEVVKPIWLLRITCSIPPTPATGSYTLTPRQLPRAYVTSRVARSAETLRSAMPTVISGMKR